MESRDGTMGGEEAVVTDKYTPEERALLARYVTDLEGDVYCIYNLPEEVIAVIFAYVSRSPKSFRDNLLQLLQAGDLDLMTLPGAGAAVNAVSPEMEWTPAVERARRFHERWTVGYGHASVAEHAVVRVGVERISRFASGLLETANPFLSFTEYSQRYQRPQRGAYYVPPELEEHPREKAKYTAFQESCYDVYEQLLTGLHGYLLEHEPALPGESEEARSRRLEKLAFEDARYALSLATHTNLGMTGNARAIRDALVALFSQPWPEVQQLAERIKGQVQRLVPTLLRYAEANEYRQAAAAQGRAIAEHWGWIGSIPSPPSRATHAAGTGSQEAGAPGIQGETVRLLDWTGRGTDEPEEGALDAFLTAVALESAAGGAGSQEAAAALARWSLEEKRAKVREILSGLGPHDQPPAASHRIRYSVEFLVSEANWHQLLRHCRRIDFVAEQPHPWGGLTIPPRLEAARLGDLLRRLGDESQAIAQSLVPRFPHVAPYLVLNAHRRRVLAEFNMWEFYHLVNLRSSPEAQWDIRQTVLALHREVARVHPTLAAGAIRRLDRPEETLRANVGAPNSR